MHCFVIKEFLEELWVGVNEELNHFQQSKAVHVAKVLVEQLFSCKSYNCEEKENTNRTESRWQNFNHEAKQYFRQHGKPAEQPYANLENTHLTQEFVIKKFIAIQIACFCLCKRSGEPVLLRAVISNDDTSGNRRGLLQKGLLPSACVGL